MRPHASVSTDLVRGIERVDDGDVGENAAHARQPASLSEPQCTHAEPSANTYYRNPVEPRHCARLSRRAATRYRGEPPDGGGEHARAEQPPIAAHAVPTLVPADEHNRTLLQNVHPPEWRNPEPAPRYNLVVIGAGTAGLVTAAGAAGLGARVALVERYLLGGDCLNVGCVPSKCVIRSSRVVGDVHDAARLGVPLRDGAQPDFG